ncbi:MAG: 2-phospho-L-lactate guanylyltransferase [Marmoricola sp.]
MDPEQSPAYVVLVPVKPWAHAKTRLTTHDGARRRALVEGFARDVVASAAGCRRVAAVYVVTAQPGFAPDGARTLPDLGRGDLNAALSAADEHVRTENPWAAVAALCADLPCLLPDDLAVALDESAGRRGFVADLAGTGTTLLVAAPGAPLVPMFGAGSARAHEDHGARPVLAEVATLRLDVDTGDDLDLAVRRGVGPNTAGALAT